MPPVLEELDVQEMRYPSFRVALFFTMFVTVYHKTFHHPMCVPNKNRILVKNMFHHLQSQHVPLVTLGKDDLSPSFSNTLARALNKKKNDSC